MASLIKYTGDRIKNRILGLVNCKILGDEEKPNQKIERAASGVDGNQVECRNRLVEWSVLGIKGRLFFSQEEESDQWCQMLPRPR